MRSRFIYLLLFLSSVTLRAQQPVPVTLRIEDERGRPTPVRVRITQNNRIVKQLPPENIAVMYGLWDHADGYGFQPDSAFYIAGTARMALPPGHYQIEISKGMEYLSQKHPLVVQSGKRLNTTYRLKRWIHMVSKGWFSADNHIHIRRSPRDNPLLLDWLRAEDLNMGILLKMGDFWETYYPQYAFGAAGTYQQGNYVLASGQEDPRTPELGHAIGIGSDKSVRYREDYYYFDKVFDELHRRGGLTGYAHQAESFHGYRGLSLDGLRGKVDLLEILQFCHDEQPLRTTHYYHMLDLGFPLTAVAGSDFPWCGHNHQHGPAERSARIGNARFYTYIEGTFSYDKWLAALRQGHTVATTGPMLLFRVNNRLPGERVSLSATDSVEITAEALGHAGQVPLQMLELVGHGKILARVSANEAGQSAERLSVTFRFKPERGMWLAARCYGLPPSDPNGKQHIAHTTPVYVSVNGDGFHNPETVQQYLQRSEQYLQEIENELNQHRDNPEFRAWYYQKGLKERIAETRRIIAELSNRLK